MSNWIFNADNVENWAFSENFLSKEECDSVTKFEEESVVSNIKTLNKTELNLDIRKSTHKWISPNEHNEWLFRKLTDCILHLNNNFFNFDIFGLLEPLQLTKYEKNGKYGKHIDKIYKSSVRKLSISVQLTPPEEYTGGELKLYFTEKPIIMPKDQGTLIIFPSYVLHEVASVKTGGRDSLVTWVSGKPFK